MNMMVQWKEELFARLEYVNLQATHCAHSRFQQQAGGTTSAHFPEAPQPGAALKWTARGFTCLERSKTVLHPAAAASALSDFGRTSTLVCRSLQRSTVMLSTLLRRRRRDALLKERVSINLEAPDLWPSLLTVPQLSSKLALVAPQQSCHLPPPKRQH